jgi:hypothetical protein
MQNLHEPSKLLTHEAILKLTAAFTNAWIRETCFPTLRAKWSESNKAMGQCATTALVVHDMYGGTFADDRHQNHVWNILPDGSQHDFCRMQFESGVEPKATTTKTRDELLHHKKAEEVEMEKRYRLLKERVDDLI